MQIFNLLDRMEFLDEVAIIEYNEWATNREENKDYRIKNKIRKIKALLKTPGFCKLILVDNNVLVGFISIFPNDCEERPHLTPWYSTMFVKKEYRGMGCSKILNNAILDEARNRNYKVIYLKTSLTNYYEKFGALFIENLNDNEKLYKFDL